MTNITETINQNIEVVVKKIEDKKVLIKKIKDDKLRAETRIEENQKALDKDFEEVKEMGYEPENIEKAIAEIDKTLENYNTQIVEYLNVLNS